jgi:hypothetical protein
VLFAECDQIGAGKSRLWHWLWFRFEQLREKQRRTGQIAILPILITFKLPQQRISICRIADAELMILVSDSMLVPF